MELDQAISKARGIARRVQAGERVAMRRWLRRIGIDLNIHATANALEANIGRLGGNSKEIKQAGRDYVTEKIIKEVCSCQTNNNRVISMK